MSKRTRTPALGQYASGLVFALLLCGLLFFVSSCESLDTNAASPTATVPAGTGQEDATESSSSASLVFGLWDGTYTPLAVWDENGDVDDPPLALGVPLGMHLELHPWSEVTGDYGTVSVGGVSSGRVTVLDLSSQAVRLSVMSEAEGLEDLHSVFTLTLQGDTLVGEDSGDPAVPTGWRSTSGTISLTRTGAWDDTGTTDGTTEAVGETSESSGETDSGSGGEEAGDDSSFEELPFVVMSLYIPEPERTDWYVDEGDDGSSMEVRVGDLIFVTFRPSAADEVWAVSWTTTAPSTMELRGHHPEEDYASVIVDAGACFRAVAPGNVGIMALLRHEDGSLFDMWQVYVEVTD